MKKRLYVRGDIWEDRDGDEWEVQEDGTLFCGPLDWYRTPEQVENGWGPLVLKTPADDGAKLPTSSCGPQAQFEIPENLLDEKFIQDASSTYAKALELLLKKNADYGSKNISESPGGPLNGLRVRMWDKMARINNLMDSGVEPENESLRDSFQDIANYGLIAMMVLDGKWPGANKESAGGGGKGNGS